MISYDIWKNRSSRTDNPYTTPVLQEVAEDSYKRLIAPAIEREIRSELTEKAEDGAIEVFGKNLRPASDAASNHRQEPCLAGIRHSEPDVNLAVVDPTGKVIGYNSHLSYCTDNTERRSQASKRIVLKKIIDEVSRISLISVGNGTASRESEHVYRRVIKRDSGNK